MTDANGTTETDRVDVEAVGVNRIRLAEHFSGAGIPDDRGRGRVGRHRPRWHHGWSPLGDGVNALRVGTYALRTGDGSADRENYAGRGDARLQQSSVVSRSHAVRLRA